ncbi:MAG: hypothetical protein F6K10_42565 [Moorea sp. SIO2B7]|nr:hypothetical protein [Moorena sp. SIO2B7]
MTTEISAFQKAIDTVESLSIDYQILLIDILQKQIAQQQREQLLQEVQEAEKDYAQGNIKRGGFADLMAELDS